jgi:hypothetical protein
MNNDYNTNKRGGGGVSSKGKRNKIQENDVFFNKPVAEFMLNYLKPHLPKRDNLKILDECANDGVLGYTLEKICSEKNTISTLDIRDIKINGESALDHKPDYKYDLIIVNPPFVPVTLPESIYHHLYNLLSDDGVMLYIINSTFTYQGFDRAKELKFQKYYFLPRYTFRSVDRPLLDVGVMMCHKNKIMPINAIKLNCFIPIDRELCKLEYKPYIKYK